MSKQELKSPIKKQKNKDINNHSLSIYRQRLSRDRWLKINHRRIYITITCFFIISTIVSILVSNLFGVYVIDTINNQFYVNDLWNPIWLIKPYPVWWSYLGIGISVLFFTLAPLLFFRKFLKLKHTKDNWVTSEESGTAHFLTDERTPWTMRPKLEAQYYPRTYFLDKGDWIIRLDRTNDYDTFLNQSLKRFTFNDPNGMDLDKLLIHMKVPTGTYRENVILPSANEVITMMGKLSNHKIKQSSNEFISKTKSYLINAKLKPVIIQTAGDSPNAYVLGGTGSGKTTKLNYPTIVANANAHQQPSFFISDPKGELYATLSGYLSALGYQVYSLDLFDLIRSQGWNPFQDVYHKFVAKGVLKNYLKQYEETRIYFNVELFEDKNDNIDWSIKLDEIKNEFIHKGFTSMILDADLKSKVMRDRNSSRSFSVASEKKNNIEFSLNHTYLTEFFKKYKIKYDQKIYESLKFNDENEIKITLENMYDEIYEYVLKKVKHDLESLKLKWKDDIPLVNETTGHEYPLWSYDDYKIIDERIKRMNITSLDDFKFDDSFIINEYYLKNKELLYPRLIGNDENILKNYVCSNHTATHAHLECLCHTSPDRSENILFDNYVFKTRSALKLHFNTTLNTQISEQIRIIQNAIFHTEKSDHWIASAGKMFGGILYNFGYRVEDDVNSLPLDKFNMSSLTILPANENDFNEEVFFNELSYLQTLVNSKHDLSEYELSLVNYRIQELLSRSDFILLNPIFTTADGERTSIKSTFSTQMSPFNSDGVKLLTAFSDITFEKLIDPETPKAIFVGINVNDPTYHPFIVLFISILHQKLSEKAKKSGGALKRYFLFMLDEFGNIPAIPNYGKILSTCRSENMKFMSIVQSNAQLERIYEKDKTTILANKGLNIYIKSDDYETAKYYSDLLGTTTYDVSKTTPAKDGWLSEKTEFKHRSLMTPDEIKNIDSKEFHDTIFFSQSKPIIVQVKPWYKVFNTKDFGTYRPIQFLPNAYTIKQNQLNYRKDVYKEYKSKDDNYIINFYDIKDNQELIDLALINKNKDLDDEDDNEIETINAQNEFLSKQKSLNENNNNDKLKLIDMLIKTFKLEFFDVNGKTLKQFKSDLKNSMKDLRDYDYLLQNFNLTNGFNYNFSEDEFKNAMFEFLDQLPSSNQPTQYVVETKQKYRYQYVDHEINTLIIQMAIEYLQSKNKDNTYIELKQLLSEHTYVVDNTIKMINLLINWEFLSKYQQDDLKSDNLLQTLAKWTSRFVDDKSLHQTPLSKLFYDLLKEVDASFYHQIKSQPIDDKIQLFDWSNQDNEWFYETHLKNKEVIVSIQYYQELINQLFNKSPTQSPPPVPNPISESLNENLIVNENNENDDDDATWMEEEEDDDVEKEE